MIILKFFTILTFIGRAQTLPRLAHPFMASKPFSVQLHIVPLVRCSRKKQQPKLMLSSWIMCKRYGNECWFLLFVILQANVDGLLDWIRQDFLILPFSALCTVLCSILYFVGQSVTIIRLDIRCCDRISTLENWRKKIATPPPQKKLFFIVLFTSNF